MSQSRLTPKPAGQAITGRQSRAITGSAVSAGQTITQGNHAPLPLLEGGGEGPLRTCWGCEGFSRWLAPNGLCRNCVNAWRVCLIHGRLEHAGEGHRKVTVAEVVAAVPKAKP
jgi:hypothetical protein